MVRIILDKTGVMVNDIILKALVDKCERNGLYVKSSINESKRATIILIENITGQWVIDKLNAQEKAVACGSCTTIFIRGMLPPANEVPFRCLCGKWVGLKKSLVISH
jgi:hypothetical protein